MTLRVSLVIAHSTHQGDRSTGGGANISAEYETDDGEGCTDVVLHGISEDQTERDYSQAPGKLSETEKVEVEPKVNLPARQTAAKRRQRVPNIANMKNLMKKSILTRQRLLSTGQTNI